MNEKRIMLVKSDSSCLLQWNGCSFPLLTFSRLLQYFWVPRMLLGLEQVRDSQHPYTHTCRFWLVFLGYFSFFIDFSWFTFGPGHNCIEFPCCVKLCWDRWLLAICASENTGFSKILYIVNILEKPRTVTKFIKFGDLSSRCSASI